MASPKRLAAILPALPIAGALYVFRQVRRAAHRIDLPSFPNQDPSGVFGDPSAPPLEIVAVGDSSITAPGVTDLDAVWVRRIAIDLAAERRVELVALAVGGSRIADVLEGQLNAAVRMAPDVAIVSVGVNDAIRNTPKRRFSRDLTRVVERLLETAGAVVVVGIGDLGAVPRLPPSLRPWLTMRGRMFDDLCAEVAAAHERAVKVYTEGRMSTAFRDDPALFAPDLFHAGDAGHAVFAEEAMPAVRSAIVLAEAARGIAGRV